MARYVYINNFEQKGKLAISRAVFDSLVANALTYVNGISKSAKRMAKDQKVRLNRPVISSIVHGIVHIWVAIDVRKEANLREVLADIRNEIESSLLIATETIPFDVQIKVESLI